MAGVKSEPGAGVNAFVPGSVMTAGFSGAGMEEVVDRPRGCGVDARGLGQVLEGGALDRLHGPEMVEQRALAAGTDAGDLVQGVLHHLSLALGPVAPDGEAVRLVAESLHEVERRVARRKLERRPARYEKR